ncbi:MAG TPA: DUF2703 domain-containing protein [Nitrospiria bacterium]|nr:DUF2703 domain-containing protein [Nitrospiria bacterium]
MNKKDDEIPPAARRRIDIEFLYVDLTVCTRCRGTDEHLQEAMSAVSNIADAAGVEISLRKTLVKSEEQAMAVGLVISPTIRVNGRDIAPELRESRCASCESRSCDGVACRVWLFRGKEYTEAPTAMIVEAILREIYRDTPAQAAVERPRGLPENLRRFFAGKRENDVDKKSSCCPPAEQEVCCETSEKMSCCAASEGSCGCR